MIVDEHFGDFLVLPAKIYRGNDTIVIPIFAHD